MSATRVSSLFHFALFALTLCVSAAAQSQFVSPKNMPSSKQTAKHLVVIGASYAGDWGQPELPGYRVTNKGVGGEESWQVAARFEKDAVDAKPDLVLIWGHINDITRSTPDRYAFAKERAIKSYQEMISQARMANVRLILATEITLPTAISWREWIPAAVAKVRGKESYAAKINRQVKEINSWLRKTAAQENIPLLDLEQAVDDGSGARKPEYTLADRSHVTPAGYAAITQYARAHLPR